MKTTLDLDDDLLIEAKSVAARRHTTLKALVEHALRRELQPPPEEMSRDSEKFEVGPLGFLRLKRNLGEKITQEQIDAVAKDISDEEFRRALGGRRR